MTVGYIGDGSNDALAIRYADVGISMKNATIATKSASDMILLDDSLNGVLEAVKTGRIIFKTV